MSFKRESTFFFHVQSIDSKKLRKTKLEKQAPKILNVKFNSLA